MGNNENVILSDVALSINTGLDAIRRAPIVDRPTEIRCLRIQDISQNKPYSKWGYTETTNIDFLKYKLRKDDIIMARTCSTGINYLVKEDMAAVFNNGLARIRLDTARIYPPFAYYIFQSLDFANFIHGISGGTSVQLNMKVGDLTRYRLRLPPLSVQNGIASILSLMDDRIALLRETNATLEAIAQALFKSWFVDFDPVHAKARGESPQGMDDATAAQFPDSFEESELGMIPKGWKVTSLDNIAHFLNGLALQKFPPEDEQSLPVIKIAQLRKGDTTGADRASRFIKPEYIIQNGDVLFSWSGSLEVETWSGGEGALNQHLFKVTSDMYPKWFYYRWTKQHLSSFQQIAASKATTMGHIQRKHLTEALVVIPSEDVLSEADMTFNPLLNQWINNALQAQTLAQLRDTLLPKLISGQLQLPEAEALLAEELP